MESPEVTEHRVRSLSALARVIEWSTPWLVEVGSWVQGGLIALNLVVIAALITIGPVDRAVRIAVAAFACALPFDVAGIVLLRLIKDVRDVRLDDLALQAFQESRFPELETYLPPAGEREPLARRRARIALAYAVAIAALSVALTLAGLVASLWHMGPWIAGAFAAAMAVSVAVLGAAAMHAQPPPSETGRELRRRQPTPRPREESR